LTLRWFAGSFARFTNSQGILVPTP
jgi:hypothetical protein